MRSISLAIIAALLPAAAFAAPMAGLTNSGGLVFFDSESPALVGAVALSGLPGGETLVGIDTRPATGELFALTSSGRVAVINPRNGVVSVISSVPTTLLGSAFGLDFNPTVDRIRMISDADQNLRFVPNTGDLAAIDSNLTPAGDKVGTAYDRSFPGSTLTTMFVIDSTSNSLARQGGVDGTPSPNGGAITEIGPLNVDINLQSDIDISQSGAMRAAFGVGAGSGLYAVDIATGAATLRGNFPTGTVVTDLTFIPAFPTQTAQSVPSLSTWGTLGLGLALALGGLVAVRRRA